MRRHIQQRIFLLRRSVVGYNLPFRIRLQHVRSSPTSDIRNSKPMCRGDAAPQQAEAGQEPVVRQ